MEWSNGRLVERPQGDDIGRVSIDWVVDVNTTITFTDLIPFKNAGAKDKFKADAIAYKDAEIARLAKEASIGTTITTFMNA